ncbi:MAG: imidazolonepropionase [Bacteroidetes bacterium]|nr:imidazolonepropionase [Bacteroidota bacterium]MCL5034325.1 imidazolonepropionase [Bacteroidota bacterium]
MNLILKNPAGIVTCSSSGKRFKRGNEMNDIGLVVGADILVEGGVIKEIGTVAERPDCDVFDVSGKIIVPGFVDSHTHLIFAGTREREFAMRAKGKTYGEIAAAGGGIIDTVRKTREMPRSKLRSQAQRRLDKMLKWGSTAVEIKSGYGLDFATEMRILETANELKEQAITDIVVTFLGAHALPPEHANNRENYIRIVIEELIPQIARKNLADFCDVFCDEGFFTTAETEKILKSARDNGLRLKMHADELASNGGVELAAALNVVSVDHLENISAGEIELLAKSETVGVVLPSVAPYIRGKVAPARQMIDSGCALAIASDFNPGTSMVDNMQTVMWLAVSLNQMTVEEALNAATINAAAAVGLSDRLGSIEVGKQADMIILNAEDYSYLPYHFTENIIANVVKNGTVLEFS